MKKGAGRIVSIRLPVREIETLFVDEAALECFQVLGTPPRWFRDAKSLRGLVVLLGLTKCHKRTLSAQTLMLKSFIHGVTK